jgi:hypothetical protein
VGSVEDSDFAKQNDRDAAASPLACLPTKPLKQGFDVPPQQAAAYRTGEAQGFAGASASFYHGTATRYHGRLPFNSVLERSPSPGRKLCSEKKIALRWRLRCMAMLAFLQRDLFRLIKPMARTMTPRSTPVDAGIAMLIAAQYRVSIAYCPNPHG